MTATRPTGTLARFIAYERKPDRTAAEDGTTIAIRAETFVEEYLAIRIAGLQEKSSNGFDTVYVKFDAASVGIQYDFGASTEAMSPIADRLRVAFDRKEPVYVALETCRRKTREGTKDPIPVTTGIHELRGASRDDLKGDPQATKRNCVKVIAAVGHSTDTADTVFGSSKDLRSDPTEWAQLRENRRGPVAPPGGGSSCVMAYQREPSRTRRQLHHRHRPRRRSLHLWSLNSVNPAVSLPRPGRPVRGLCAELTPPKVRPGNRSTATTAPTWVRGLRLRSAPPTTPPKLSTPTLARTVASLPWTPARTCGV
jgi:hypothetical protein